MLDKHEILVQSFGVNYGTTAPTSEVHGEKHEKDEEVKTPGDDCIVSSACSRLWSSPGS